MDLAQIERAAEQTADEVAELTSQLVQRNSAHPDGYTDEVVAAIKEYCDQTGIANEVHANDPKKPNIVAKVAGTTDKTVLWLGHVDVVPEGTLEFWTYPPYSGTIADGCVWGRGSSDMKGACACALVAARLLSRSDEPPPYNVEFWFTSDEEIGGIEGARWLAKSGRLKGEVCLIGDGHGGGLELPSLDLGCKGVLSTRLIAKGHTAHGSTPFMGDNALRKLIDVIPVVEQIGDLELELPDELDEVIESSLAFFEASQELTPAQEEAAQTLFSTPSVTCNMLNAGVKVNVVPDYAEAEFDIRLTPGCDPRVVKARLEALVASATVDGRAVEGVEIQVRAGPEAGYYESPHAPAAQGLARTIELVTGKAPLAKIVTGGTDGISVHRIAGIPSVGYGASLTGQAHQPDERISIENLVLGVKVYAVFPFVYGSSHL
jgi:succinyl-diaminopimelate desuccinylase